MIKATGPDGQPIAPECLTLKLRQALSRLNEIARTNVDGVDDDILDAEQAIRRAASKVKAAMPDISKCPAI